MEEGRLRKSRCLGPSLIFIPPSSSFSSSHLVLVFFLIINSIYFFSSSPVHHRSAFLISWCCVCSLFPFFRYSNYPFISLSFFTVKFRVYKAISSHICKSAFISICILSLLILSIYYTFFPPHITYRFSSTLFPLPFTFPFLLSPSPFPCPSPLPSIPSMATTEERVGSIKCIISSR